MYQTYKRRVEKLNEDINDLKYKDIDSVSGKVKGSMKDFPYTERRFSVQMEIPAAAERNRKQTTKREQEIEELEKRMCEIEVFIDLIEDVHIKTIFEYKFLEGMTQEEIGEKMGLDRSRISRKIDNFLKTHTKHKNNML